MHTGRSDRGKGKTTVSSRATTGHSHGGKRDATGSSRKQGSRRTGHREIRCFGGRALDSWTAPRTFLGLSRHLSPLTSWM